MAPEALLAQLLLQVLETLKNLTILWPLLPLHRQLALLVQ